MTNFETACNTHVYNDNIISKKLNSILLNTIAEEIIVSQFIKKKYYF